MCLQLGRETDASNHSSCRSYTDSSQVRDVQHEAVIFKTRNARLARGRQQVLETELAKLVQGQVFVEAAPLEASLSPYPTTRMSGLGLTARRTLRLPGVISFDDDALAPWYKKVAVMVWGLGHKLEAQLLGNKFFQWQNR